MPAFLLDRLARLRGVPSPGSRNVALKGDAQLLGLRCDCEIGIARQQRIDLDEVRAGLPFLLYRLNCFCRIVNGDRSGPKRRRAVNNCAGDNHARPEKLASLNLLAEPVVIRDSPHHPDARDAVSQEERIVVALVPVDMHVPQAGDHEFSRSVNEPSVLWNGNLAGWAKGRDAVSADHHDAVRQRWPTRYIDDRDVTYGKKLLGSLRRALREQQNAENRKEHKQSCHAAHQEPPRKQGDRNTPKESREYSTARAVRIRGITAHHRVHVPSGSIGTCERIRLPEGGGASC